MIERSRDETSHPGVSDEPATMTTGEAAELLSPVAKQLGMTMDGQRVRTLVKDGLLRAFRPTAGGWRRVERASVEAYLEVLRSQLDEMRRN